MYLEMMAEMSHPADFHQVFRINAPIQLTLYLSVALLSYFYQGQDAADYLIDSIPPGIMHGVASLLLFVHVMVAYVLKALPLATYLHSHFAPRRVHEDSFVAKLQFSLCGFSMLCLGNIVANSIPFFNTFLGLIGGLLCTPISFVLPVVLFVRLKQIKTAVSPSLKTKLVDDCEAQELPVYYKVGEAAKVSITPTNKGSEDQDLGCNAMEEEGGSLGLAQWGFICALLFFMGSVMGLGTYAQLEEVVSNASPFACRAI